MARLNILGNAIRGPGLAIEVVIPEGECSAIENDLARTCRRVAFYLDIDEIDESIRMLLKWRSEHVSVTESAS